MNKLVQAALEKLVQDETFRGELTEMLDEVNRAAKDPEMISRAEETEEEVTEEAQTAEAATEETQEQERANTVTPMVSPEMLNEVVTGILGSPTILENLLNALIDVQNNMPADQNPQAQTRDSVTAIQNTLKEMDATLKEHDKVLTKLSEDAIVEEAELPRTIRARTAVKTVAKEGDEKPSLEDRAARVLSKMSD